MHGDIAAALYHIWYTLGISPRKVHGRDYRSCERISSRGYLRWLRDPERRTARSKADADFTAAKAELIRLRVAEKKRELIEFEEAREVAEKIVTTTNVALGGMAARVGGSDMNLRRRIDDVVFEVRTQIADQFQAFAEAGAEQASRTEDDDDELSTNDR